MSMKSTAGTEVPRTSALHEKYFVWMALVVTAITYLATIRFEFVYDDSPQIVFNPFLRAWHYVPQYFVSSVWRQMAPLAAGNYYRPIFLLLMRVNYSVFGDRPLGWHLLAVAMHLVVTWLTFVLVKKLTGQFTTAWLAALIFGVHPIHHEVVAWVSGTTESLFAILFLLSFLAYLQSRQASKVLWMTIACSLYALALLSKETAIVLPALVFVHAWIEYAPSENEIRSGYAGKLRAAFGATVAFLPVALVYLLVRNKVLSGLGHSVAPISPVKWLLTLPSILFFYVKNWFLPFRLSGFYDLFYQPKLSFMHVLLPGLILIALAVAVWIFRVRLNERGVAHAVAWMLIPLLPALDTFVFTPDNLVHDRYFYVPSIGAALLVALIIERAANTRPGLFGQPSQVVLAGIVLTIGLAFFAGRAASSWSSDYAMFSRAHEIAPRNPTAMSNLAAELLTRQDLTGAKKLLEEGYRNDPSDSRFTINLGRMYYHEGDVAKAESFMMQSMESDPYQAEAYVYLGQIRLKQGRLSEAQENLRHAVTLNPYSAAFHTSYGIVLALNGDCTNADQQFEASLALNPGDPLTTIQMYRCRASLAPAAPPSTKPGQL